MLNEQDEFRLKFKEQWWCVSAFTDLDGEKLTDEINNMNNFAKSQLIAFTESKINTRFVPEAIDRQKIAALSKNLQIELTWDDYLENFNFETKKYKYDKLGYLIFRIRIKDNSDFNIFDARPNYLQQIIFQVWFGLTKKYKQELKRSIQEIL